jgi:hypothetical protein
VKMPHAGFRSLEGRTLLLIFECKKKDRLARPLRNRSGVLITGRCGNRSRLIGFANEIDPGKVSGLAGIAVFPEGENGSPRRTAPHCALPTLVQHQPDSQNESEYY